MLFKPKSKDYRKWGEVLFGTPNLPVPSDPKLCARITDQQITNFHRIVMESAKIIRSTSNERIRNDRIKLARENLRKLHELEPFADTKGKKLIREAEKTL